MSRAGWGALAGAGQGISTAGMFMFEKAKMETMQKLQDKSRNAQSDRAEAFATKQFELEKAWDKEKMGISFDNAMKVAGVNAQATTAAAFRKSVDTEKAAILRSDSRTEGDEKRLVVLQALSDAMNGISGATGGGEAVDPARRSSLIERAGGGAEAKPGQAKLGFDGKGFDPYATDMGIATGDHIGEMVKGGKALASDAKGWAGDAAKWVADGPVGKAAGSLGGILSGAVSAGGTGNNNQAEVEGFMTEFEQTGSLSPATKTRLDYITRSNLHDDRLKSAASWLLQQVR